MHVITFLTLVPCTPFTTFFWTFLAFWTAATGALSWGFWSFGLPWSRPRGGPQALGGHIFVCLELCSRRTSPWYQAPSSIPSPPRQLSPSCHRFSWAQVSSRPEQSIIDILEAQEYKSNQMHEQDVRTNLSAILGRCHHVWKNFTRYFGISRNNWLVFNKSSSANKYS